MVSINKNYDSAFLTAFYSDKMQVSPLITSSSNSILANNLDTTSFSGATRFFKYNTLQKSDIYNLMETRFRNSGGMVGSLTKPLIKELKDNYTGSPENFRAYMNNSIKKIYNAFAEALSDKYKDNDVIDLNKGFEAIQRVFDELGIKKNSIKYEKELGKGWHGIAHLFKLGDEYLVMKLFRLDWDYRFKLHGNYVEQARLLYANTNKLRDDEYGNKFCKFFWGDFENKYMITKFEQDKVNTALDASLNTVKKIKKSVNKTKKPVRQTVNEMIYGVKCRDINSKNIKNKKNIDAGGIDIISEKLACNKNLKYHFKKLINTPENWDEYSRIIKKYWPDFEIYIAKNLSKLPEDTKEEIINHLKKNENPEIHNLIDRYNGIYSEPKIPSKVFDQQLENYIKPDSSVQKKNPKNSILNNILSHFRYNHTFHN